MGRLKLSMPSEYLFSTEIEIRINDINYGGHLANDAVLAMVHEARLRFLAEYDYSEKNIEGAGLIMTDALIIYKSEAFYGERLKIEISIDDVSRLGFDLYYKLYNIIKAQEVALVKTGFAFFNYDLRKIISTPENFALKFSKRTM
jgi:acyl-CoA thioester hydrolase